MEDLMIFCIKTGILKEMKIGVQNQRGETFAAAPNETQIVSASISSLGQSLLESAHVPGHLSLSDSCSKNLPAGSRTSSVDSGIWTLRKGRKGRDFAWKSILHADAK